jgi:hypothetical protein
LFVYFARLFFDSLSEYSDENMMDPYNLAICFGPTLVPVPEDKDQVQYQNLVNELIKNIIINAEDIFPNDGGVLYERYISREPDEGYAFFLIAQQTTQRSSIFHFSFGPFFLSPCREVGEAPSDTMSEEVDSEVYPSEDGKQKSIDCHTTLFFSYSSVDFIFPVFFLRLTFQIQCFVKKISACNCLAVSFFF